MLNPLRFALLAAIVWVVLVAPQAHAGIADSPLPVLMAGATTLHLYSVPGVISGGGLATFVAARRAPSVLARA